MACLGSPQYCLWYFQRQQLNVGPACAILTCHPNVPCAPGILFRTDTALKGPHGHKELAWVQENLLRAKQVLGEYWEGSELAHRLVLILFSRTYSLIHKGNGTFVAGSLRQCGSPRLCLRGGGDSNQYSCFMSSLIPDLSYENSWLKSDLISA